MTECPINNDDDTQNPWEVSEQRRKCCVAAWVCIVMARCLCVSPCTWPGACWAPPGPAATGQPELATARAAWAGWPGQARPGRGFARQWMILYSWMDCELWAAPSSREGRGERDRGETRGSVSASGYHSNILSREPGDQKLEGLVARSDGDFECLDRVSEESELGTFVKVWLYVNTCSKNSVSWMKIWTFTPSD